MTGPTPLELISLAADVREGRADPDEVRDLLAYFCVTVNRREKVPSELLEYLAEAFQRFINGDRTLNAALGLTGKLGRVARNAPKDIDTAFAVLMRRMAGETTENATSHVAAELHRGATQVRGAWAKYKSSAFIRLRLERVGTPYPWTQNEVETLDRIYRKEWWWRKSAESVAPAKDVG